MSNIILSINAGSSSLKVSIYGPTADGPKHVVTATLSNIKTKPEFESSHIDLSNKEKDTSNVKDHDSALAHILNHLFRLVGKEDITHVCHRVVHGGEYEDRVPINDETLHHLDSLSDLAPL
jgi:acetate kinase